MKQSSVKKSTVHKPKKRISTGLNKKLPRKLNGQKGIPQHTVIKNEKMDITSCM